MRPRTQRIENRSDGEVWREMFDTRGTARRSEVVNLPHCQRLGPHKALDNFRVEGIGPGVLQHFKDLLHLDLK